MPGPSTRRSRTLDATIAQASAAAVAPVATALDRVRRQVEAIPAPDLGPVAAQLARLSATIVSQPRHEAASPDDLAALRTSLEETLAAIADQVDRQAEAASALQRSARPASSTKPSSAEGLRDELTSGAHRHAGHHRADRRGGDRGPARRRSDARRRGGGAAAVTTSRRRAQRPAPRDRPSTSSGSKRRCATSTIGWARSRSSWSGRGSSPTTPRRRPSPPSAPSALLATPPPARRAQPSAASDAPPAAKKTTPAKKAPAKKPPAKKAPAKKATTRTSKAASKKATPAKAPAKKAAPSKRTAKRPPPS